ncbi:hypothetical protein JOD29_002933 [Lysinibacillus composti]|uniref:hypothetical protein n=1 Tax=Lysinibacillus composti TaxID=720633 RepID=UPI0013153ECA|nr:hypothetical protein [Lysinibacillus composti]MBM7609657.1 hypothetical protein [Lysinibacillus composti]
MKRKVRQQIIALRAFYFVSNDSNDKFFFQRIGGNRTLSTTGVITEQKGEP